MSNCKRTSILVVDKENRCLDYFKGLRKNKFSVKLTNSVLDKCDLDFCSN